MVQASTRDVADLSARVVGVGCREGAEGVVRIQMTPQPHVNTDGRQGATRTTHSEIATAQHGAPHPPDTAEADRVRGDQVRITIKIVFLVHMPLTPTGQGVPPRPRKVEGTGAAAPRTYGIRASAVASRIRM
jgi:hypothetical protein